MAAFEYEALDPAGAPVRGVLEADGERQARSQLRDQGLLPLRVSTIVRSMAPAGRGRLLRPRSLSQAALALMTRQFATLLHAGLTIEEALNAVIEQSDDRQVRQIMAAVRTQVLEGRSLAHALTGFEHAFPPVYRHLVAAGEQSGRLDQVLTRLADYTEQRQALTQKVTLAFVYPAIVTTVAIVVVTGLLVYVVPQVTRVFIASGTALPWATRALMAISDAARWGGIWWLVGVGAIAWAVHDRLRHEKVRRRFHEWLLGLPVVGRLVRGLNAARLARTLGILVSSGVPLLIALQSAAAVVTNLPMKAAVEEAMRQVSEGGSLSRSLGRRKLFPPMLIHLLASGEASGQLDQMLERAADAQTRELENGIAVLTTLLEPVLILVMGGIVLFIVLAILLPIFDMNQLIK